MNKDMISRVILKYGINAKKCTLIKQESDRCVWKIEDKKRKYALKSLTARKAKITSNISSYLLERGIPVITLLPALNGDFIIQNGDSFFILFPWFEGEAIHYEIPGTIERMSVLLARFHEASKGYERKGRPIEQTKLNLLKDYLGQLEYMNKLYKELNSKDDPIVRVFLYHYSWLLKRCNWVIKHLPYTTYHNLVELVRLDPILGHGDYSRANILSDKKDNWKIIDLDTVKISHPLRDLSRMITWINHDLGNWDLDRYKSILQCYRDIRSFSDEEEEILILDQCFPHQAINLMRQYYEKKGSETLLEELKRCLDTDKEKIRKLLIKELLIEE
ncbi:phosphotransferase [Priestia megaterium]|uniref:phosphotransferase n=1 Tax=Priestia megaterium TaxID=1404 RepID=UPI002040E58D|nr:phosphotransferase [Priestia megaterium]MCM3197194.1 phosphotransferase [Priestia megaterium]